MNRSSEMVIAIIGVLAAGCAYLPLEPSTPVDRLQFLLADANLLLLLVDDSLMETAKTCFGGYEVTIINAQESMQPTQLDPSSCAINPIADTLAYVIYTSGSTGKPKGVKVHHSGLNNRLQWMAKELSVGASDRILFKTPYSFDVSVWEILLPLCVGATLIVAQPGLQGDADYLMNLILDSRASLIHFVPSMLQEFLNYIKVCKSLEPSFQSPFAVLRAVVCSGEALPSSVVEQFESHSTKACLFNFYGPTEASIDVTFWKSNPGNNLVCVFEI